MPVRSWRTPADLENAQTEYKNRLQAMPDELLRKSAQDAIWFSAYASSNPKSDYHWRCDFVYDECRRRKKPEIYNEELAKLITESEGSKV
jgi:hypothetical protein